NHFRWGDVSDLGEPIKWEVAKLVQKRFDVLMAYRHFKACLLQGWISDFSPVPFLLYFMDYNDNKYDSWVGYRIKQEFIALFLQTGRFDVNQRRFQPDGATLLHECLRRNLKCVPDIINDPGFD